MTWSRDYRDARRSLGVVPQELVFDPFFTVRECLRIQSGYFGLRRNDDWIDEILHHLDLSAKADTNMRRLSGGMKRRVLVAQALVHRPPVIVLDEPTAGVDVELRQSLWEFVRRLNGEGHTVVLTTHYLEEAEALCGRIAMMKQGSIVALDTTRNLLESLSGHILRLRLDGAARAGRLLGRTGAGVAAMATRPSNWPASMRSSPSCISCGPRGARCGTWNSPSRIWSRCSSASCSDRESQCVRYSGISRAG